MKIAIAILALAASASAQDFITLTPGTTLPMFMRSFANAERVRKTEDGKYARNADAVVIVEMSERGIILECTRTSYPIGSCAVYHGGAPCPDAGPRTERWREVYAVKSGRLELDRVVDPKVIPAVPAKPESYQWDGFESLPPPAQTATPSFEGGTSFLPRLELSR